MSLLWPDTRVCATVQQSVIFHALFQSFVLPGHTFDTRKEKKVPHKLQQLDRYRKQNVHENGNGSKKKRNKKKRLTPPISRSKSRNGRKVVSRQLYSHQPPEGGGGWGSMRRQLRVARSTMALPLGDGLPAAIWHAGQPVPMVWPTTRHT